MARGLVLSIVKKSCKKIVAQCTIGVRTVIALLLKKLLTKLTAMIYKKVRISNMDGNKKMYNYVPTLESLEYSLFCKECDCNLCNSCNNDHSNFKLTRNHEMLLLKSTE